MGELINIPVGNLHANLNGLREVIHDDPEFLDVLASVKRDGQLTPIRVKFLEAAEYEEDYEIIFGHHRHAAAIELGFETIEAVLVDATEAESMIQQIVENVVRVKQNPIQVRDQLLLYIATTDKNNSVEDLAKLISKPVEYIKKVMGLQKLANEQIEALVFSGTISATNAYKMAKLNPNDQESFLDQASCLPTVEFGALVDARLKEVRDAKRAGGAAAAPVFIATPRFRKMPDLVAVIENGNDSEDFKAGVAYAVSLDGATIEAAKGEWDRKQEAVAAKNAQKEADRDKKKEDAKAKKQAAKDAKAELMIADAEAIKNGTPTSADVKRAEKKAAKEAEAAEAGEAEAACDFMEKGGAFLPFVRFCVGQTKAVQKAQIGINRYGLFQGQDVTDLGPEIDVAVLARRPKAMDTSGEEVITTYDPKVVDGAPTGEFKRIMEQSGVKDSGCMYGTEYLIYIGGEFKQFATIHFASITARNESKKMTARKGNFATLKFEEIVTKKFEYNAIKVLACSDGSLALMDLIFPKRLMY